MLAHHSRYNELTPAEERHIWELHRAAITIDALQVPILDRQMFADMADGGVTALACTCVHGTNRTARDGVMAIQRYRDWVEAHPDCALIATRAADIELAKRQNKAAIILGFQHDSFVEDQIDMLRVFHTMGLRIFQLTYNRRGPFADGCLEPANGGLSGFGRQGVKELNRLRILIDLSHTGDRAVMETIDLSEAPVAFTHANPRARSNTPRGKTDEQIKALAAKGGVIGVTFWASISAVKQGVRPGVEDIVDHIDYLAELVGIDHVAFGSDFNEGVRSRAALAHEHNLFLKAYPEVCALYAGERDPIDLEDTCQIPNVTRGLVARGYRDEDICKILGGNWMRLFREVWGE